MRLTSSMKMQVSVAILSAIDGAWHSDEHSVDLIFFPQHFQKFSGESVMN